MPRHPDRPPSIRERMPKGTALTMTRTEKPAAVAMADHDQVILKALSILRARFKERNVFSSPDSVKDYLRLQGQGLDHEVFSVMHLDSQNRLIEYERMFRGTLTQTSVYPREVVKLAGVNYLVRWASTILAGLRRGTISLLSGVSAPFAQAGHAPPARRACGSSPHSSPGSSSGAPAGRRRPASWPGRRTRRPTARTACSP
jgi:hypothetical protein